MSILLKFTAAAALLAVGAAATALVNSPVLQDTTAPLQDLAYDVLGWGPDEGFLAAENLCAGGGNLWTPEKIRLADEFGLLADVIVTRLEGALRVDASPSPVTFFPKCTSFYGKQLVEEVDLRWEQSFHEREMNDLVPSGEPKTKIFAKGGPPDADIVLAQAPEPVPPAQRAQQAIAAQKQEQQRPLERTAQKQEPVSDTDVHASMRQHLDALAEYADTVETRLQASAAAALQAERARQEAEQALERVASEAAKAMQERDNIRSRAQQWEAEVERYGKRNAELEKQVANLQSQLDSVRAENESAKKNARAQLAALSERMSELAALIGAEPGKAE